MDVSIVLSTPTVLRSPYVPHEDFRPASSLIDTRDPPTDAAVYNTDTALRFAKISQCFHMSEPVDTVELEPVDTDHTPTRLRSRVHPTTQLLSCYTDTKKNPSSRAGKCGGHSDVNEWTSPRNGCLHRKVCHDPRTVLAHLKNGGYHWHDGACHPQPEQRTSR